jgi:DUF1365 family protein
MSPVTASCLYEGAVRHRRFAPAAHEFSYRLFMCYLDLSELPELFDGHPLWSARRPAPAWFRRADYHGDPTVPLDEAIRALVGERTGHRPAGPIRLLTHLRYFGHIFNPVSFYWCLDSSANVEAVVAEVTNTPWGERYAYVLEPSTERLDKRLHVSPFMGMDCEYAFVVGEPGERLGVHISNHDRVAGSTVFSADLALRRRAIDRRSLTVALLRHPPMTAKVLAAIYFEALRLRLKGNPVHPHPEGAR